MRIDRLSLVRYGCFTDLTLDLAAPGLHVVVGPNEAGKSTSRAAVSDLLFGFPLRTPQAHIHATSDLCLSATLSTLSGPVSLERHKRKPHLRGADGLALGDEVLAEHSAISRELYEALFALGHEELRAGAAELLRSGGDVGRVLFGVTAGRAGAAALLDRLGAEADELFKPRSQKRGVMALLAVHSEARGRLDTATLPPTTWSRAAEELQRVEATIAQRQEERSDRVAQLATLQAARSALPLLARRAHALEARSLLTGPYLLPDLRDRVVAALARTDDAARVERGARDELARMEGVTPSAPAADDVLSYEGEVVALQEQLGGYREALLDLPRMEMRAAASEAAVSAAAARCGMAAPVTAVSGGLPPAATQAEALLLATELEQARRARDEAAMARALAEEARAAACSALDRSPPVRCMGAVAEALDALRAALADTQLLRSQAEQAERLCSDQELSRDGLVARTSLPTVDELAVVRRSRDERWHALRAAWASGDPFDEGAATAVEEHIAAADSIADRRQADAQASGHLAAVEEAATKAAQRRDAAVLALRAAEERLSTASAELEQRLGDVGAGAVVERQPEALVAFGAAILEEAAAAQSERARLESAVESAAGALAGAITSENTAAAAVEEVEERWGQTCRAVGVAPQLSPTAVRAHLSALHALAEALADSAQATSDLEVVRARVSAFELAAESVAAKVVPAPGSDSPGEIATELGRRLRAAVEQHAAGEAATRRRVELLATADAAATTIATEAASLAEISMALGCSPDDLPSIAERSARVDALDAEIADVDRLIAESTGGAVGGVEAAASAFGNTSPGELEAQIAISTEALTELDQDLEALHVRRGELRKTLDQWRGADEAARAAAAMQEAGAAVAETAARYVRLRVAHEILRREVERNREQHQGPVLRRAASHLAALTANRYVDILDAADDGAVLDVRRYDGEVVGIDRLSEGTRDQLWLALRLAALERWCEDREPLPLVLDDVCMTFDDERTASALQLLAQLSERIQVLFFTHHESVAATAARVVPDGLVHVHRLERFSPPVVQPAPRRAPRAKKPTPAA